MNKPSLVVCSLFGYIINNNKIKKKKTDRHGKCITSVIKNGTFIATLYT